MIINNFLWLNLGKQYSVVAVMDKTIYMIAFNLSNTVDVDVSKRIMSFTQWRHKKKTLC
jgi:hypothetical protein